MNFECFSVVSEESDITSGLRTAEKMGKMAVSGIRGRCLVCKRRSRCGFDINNVWIRMAL